MWHPLDSFLICIFIKLHINCQKYDAHIWEYQWGKWPRTYSHVIIVIWNNICKPIYFSMWAMFFKYVVDLTWKIVTVSSMTLSKNVTCLSQLLQDKVMGENSPRYNDITLYMYIDSCCAGTVYTHDDIIKWIHFPRYWPFVRGIHWWLVNFPHKGQWCIIWSALEQTVGKQSRRRSFETPSRSL